MSAQKYVIHIVHTTNHKNNLEKAVHDYFKSIDQTIHPKLEDLKEQISHEVEVINLQHPRCKEVVIYFDDWSKHPSPLIYIRGCYSITVHILICKEVGHDS